MGSLLDQGLKAGKHRVRGHAFHDATVNVTAAALDFL
jgi:hypothetical protein